jgi:hypothetical protein
MKKQKKTETIKIEGYSVGDMSVGIGSIPFQIDTGLFELEDYEKENIIKTLIRDVWEMHDNGTLRYEFSDEHKDDEFDFGRRFTFRDSQTILEERRKDYEESK